MCIFPALLSPKDVKVDSGEDEGMQLSGGGTRNALLKGTGRFSRDRLGLDAFKATCQIVFLAVLVVWIPFVTMSA